VHRRRSDPAGLAPRGRARPPSRGRQHPFSLTSDWRTAPSPTWSVASPRACWSRRVATRDPSWTWNCLNDSCNPTATVRRSSRSNGGRVRRPTPRRRATGCALKRPGSVSEATISPAGVPTSKATLATPRFGPMPTETLSPSVVQIAALIRRPTVFGGPINCPNPLTSSNASSMEIDSSTGKHRW